MRLPPSSGACDGQRYSALNQITTVNVRNLRPSGRDQRVLSTVGTSSA